MSPIAFDLLQGKSGRVVDFMVRGGGSRLCVERKLSLSALTWMGRDMLRSK